MTIVGCSGGMSPQTGALPSQPALHHAASRTGGYPTNKSLLFEGDQLESAVNIYQTAELKKNPPPIATIQLANGCPFGMAMDAKSTLYVADNCSNDVAEYPKGSTTLKTTITQGISRPVGLAVDEHGTLFVTSFAPAAIMEYPKGSTSPSKTITGGGLSDVVGLALDHAGNLYAADLDADAVFELPAGGSSVKNLNLQSLGSPTGVAIDQKTGDLWETSENDVINVYRLGSSANPIETIPGNGFPFAISIENRGKPNGLTVESDAQTDRVYAFEPGSYMPYATLTNGISFPSGLLIAKP